MTTLREAAQQALEALELALAPFPLDDIRCHRAAEALRAALAEHFCDTHCTWLDHAPGCVRAEPVAWYHVPYPGSGISPMVSLSQHHEPSMYGAVVPLYLATPQRKPLTEEEIAAAANLVRWSNQYHVDFARAIERAHGIGGSNG